MIGIDANVLVETVWVIEDLYGTDRPHVTSIVETLLHASTVVVADAEMVWRALTGFRADFADYLIHDHSAAAECTAVYTFDKLAARDSEMQLLRRPSN